MRVTEETDPNVKPNYGLTIAIVMFTPCLGVVYAAEFVLINASFKEISFSLLKAELLDIYSNNNHRSKVIDNFHVSSPTRSRSSYKSVNQ